MRERRRSPWYLLTGLIIGALIGILYGWGLAPVQYIETSPASLREDFKQEYMVQIALAYAATGDPARAQARLALLNEDDLPSQVAALAQRGLATGRPETEVRALGLLAALAETMSSQVPGEETTQPTMEPTASATSTETNTPQPTDTPTATLQPSATPTIPPPTATFTESQATQVTTETSAPTPTQTQTPTQTPTATPGLPYILDSQELICDPNYQQPLLIVRIQDAAGNGVPGVHIIVSHTGGEDNFFTGLKPELGLDYADYVMQPSIQYTLRLQDGSQRITGLEVQTCTGEDDAAFWGSWELIFVQPR